MHAKALRGATLDQRSGQIAVDLDDLQVVEMIEQRIRQRTATWADFDQPVIGLRIDCAHDAFDDRAVDQKILTETLAWSM